MSINGGAVLAMRGKNCVAIASDLRFGVQALLVSNNSPKVFELAPRLYFGASGLATDITTVRHALRYHLNTYKLKEEREASPQTAAKLLSSLQYSRRFGPWFIEPIVAGLGAKGEPYICTMDTIGCMNEAPDFAVVGTATEQLYGMCEALYEPDLEAEDLFEVASQALLNACNRDALSGWGAIVHVMYYPFALLIRRLSAVDARIGSSQGPSRAVKTNCPGN